MARLYLYQGRLALLLSIIFIAQLILIDGSSTYWDRHDPDYKDNWQSLQRTVENWSKQFAARFLRPQLDLIINQTERSNRIDIQCKEVLYSYIQGIHDMRPWAVK